LTIRTGILLKHLHRKGGRNGWLSTTTS